MAKKTKEQFIAQANAIWHSIYDYSESDFRGSKMPITTYCPKHDYHFTLSMAQNHVIKPSPKAKPTGCPYCSRESGNPYNHRLLPGEREQREREKAERQRQRAEELARQKVAREQRKAQRWQAYQDRLQQQKEETRRRHEADRAERQRQNVLREQARIKALQDRFREEAPKKQGDGYIYKGVEQITKMESLVMVHCPNPDHEWHSMLVRLILQGCKCRECAGRQQSVEQRREKFLADFHRKHGQNRFQVTADGYVNNDTPIQVRCLIHHYDYKTTPDTLLRGGGCPYCTASKGEAVIKGWLDNHNIPHEWHAQIPNEDPTLPLQYVEPDFWLAHLNLYIEYHGEQHYEDVDYFYKGKKLRKFAVQQQRDRYLRDYCQRHAHLLLEIPYWDFDSIEEILTKALINNQN